jgi:hypothetical protein
MLQSADADEQDRLARFKLGWEVYEGDMKRPLRVEFGEPDDNVILPFARRFVDASINFLLGEDLEFQGENEEIDELIDRSWSGGSVKANKKMLTLNKLAINGAVTGQFFLKMIPQKDFVRLSVLDPSYVSVLWSQEDIDDVRRYRIQWPIIGPDNKPAVRRQDHTKQDSGTWLIEDFISKSGSAVWEIINTEVWPFDFPAIVDGQNLVRPNEYWGESDLERGLIQINDALNSVISDVRKILRYHASPKTIAEGITPDQFDMLNADPSALIFLPEGADLRNLELTGDLEASVRTYLELKSAMHEIGSIPEVATGKLENIGNLSARAMQIIFKPMTDFTTTKRMTAGHVINETNRRIALIHKKDADLIPDIIWPDVLPKDGIEERQAAEADLRMGVASKQTVSAKLGYDWDIEQSNIEDERSSLGEMVLTDFDRGDTDGVDEIEGRPV